MSTIPSPKGAGPTARALSEQNVPLTERLRLLSEADDTSVGGYWGASVLVGKLGSPLGGEPPPSVQDQRTALEDLALRQQAEALAARLRGELSAATLRPHETEEVVEAVMPVLNHLVTGRSFFLHSDAKYRAELLRRQLGEWGQQLRSIPTLGAGLLDLWSQLEELALTNERRGVCRARQVAAAPEAIPDWMVEEEATDYEEGRTPFPYRPMW